MREILFRTDENDIEDAAIVARLIELGEEDSELGEKLSRLMEIGENLDLLDEEESTDLDEVPVQTKTDLFGTEGDDAPKSRGSIYVP